MRKRAAAAQLGLELSTPATPWPPPDRFPYNFGGDTVGSVVSEDLASAQSPLVITGYAAIEQLLGFLHACHLRRQDPGGQPTRIRLLIGVEPTLPRTVAFGFRAPALQQEVIDYWLERGISLLHSREVFSALTLLETGVLEVRSSDQTRVHAKMYVAEAAATLGSSNYTTPGLERNLEANVRFAAAADPERYAEAVQFAENLWRLGGDFSTRFKELLETLLGKVTWQEALVRASAELLEGEWSTQVASSSNRARSLWPSQAQGITQALWVLENVGSVLVADATGSGKTKMGAELLGALQDRNWRTGRQRPRATVLVCPPQLIPDWKDELHDAGEDAKVFSHGVLSRQATRSRVRAEEALRVTQSLVVDEAHNFLNRASQRSRVLYGNVADHTILLTATPINRGARDLLSVVDLLGADNFDEDVLDVVTRLARTSKGAAGQQISTHEREIIRRALQHFVVRRTKADFNALIDREPELYINALGEPCRFPEHDSQVFPRDDPKEDRQRAFAIREKAKNLRGLINLRAKLQVPRFLRMEGWTDERFLGMRLGGARALAAYQVRSRLRSSRVAVIEHIRGTEYAERMFDLRGSKGSDTGNVLDRLEAMRGHPPTSSLDTPLPEWLTDPEAHARAVDEEISVYEDLLTQTERISDHRMDANARYLRDLLQAHSRILAFDSHLISLHDLRRRLADLGESQVILATGEGSLAERRRFSRHFDLRSSEERVIGLCSDALAEGLNLQGASAVVHLDLPSVIRLLEQRIGRVDRMDSPHAQVQVHWPDEPKEFKLRSDERLFWRLEQVEDLLGSNVPVPEEFQNRVADEGDFLEVEEIIEAVERGEPSDSRITLVDAFERVRALVWGPERVVPEALYEAMTKSKARVLSSVAVVPARSPWVFLAIGASDRTVPRWALVEGGAGSRPKLLSSLDEVADAVRVRVPGSPHDIDFDEGAAELLKSAVVQVEKHQRTLLPRRKQRALEEMGRILRVYRRDAERDSDHGRLGHVRHLLSLLDSSDADDGVDLEPVAEWWLDLIRPEWHRYLLDRRGYRPARLKGLRKILKEEPLSTDRLASIQEVRFDTTPLDRRVVAAIVGVAAAAG